MNNKKKWMFALSQHPMYFLIREDTQCAERTPPWGAATIEEYIERVKRNLISVINNDIKVGFEWSAYELELLKEDSPEVFNMMVSLLNDKKVSFYNGTYAQPHLQMLSHEANYRQFEEGIKFYKEICGFPVSCYIHQEASVHDQVPQLMEHFGLKYCAIPQFGSTIKWLDGGVLNLMAGKRRFIHGDEFTRWQGLDGTNVMLYLSTRLNGDVNYELDNEDMAGLFRIPPIVFDTPDLIEINDKWLKKYERAELVLADEALAQREKDAPATSTARFYSNWSYIEGIFAESLSRQNMKAEKAIIQAESMIALANILLDSPPLSLRDQWKQILALQHHDVYCFCAPELKRKAVTWLKENEKSSREISKEIAVNIAAVIDAAPDELVVFNTSPHSFTAVVTTDITEENKSVMQAGSVLPSDYDDNKLRFQCTLDGLGYTVFTIKDKQVAVTKKLWDKSIQVDLNNISAVISPDGVFTSLAVDDLELIKGGSNVLKGTDSTGLSPWRPGMAPRRDWERPGKGKDITYTVESGTIQFTDLGITLHSNGSVGERIKAELNIQFYHAISRIDFTWKFEFDNATIGTFYDDLSKLHLSWDLGFEGNIRHDIPFGFTDSDQGRPVNPVSWLDISDEEKGFSYFHQGTLKHWIENNIFYNLFAWGENTEAIGSRMWRYNWPKAFDHRLRGAHEIQYSIYPHAGPWNNHIAVMARSYNETPIAIKGNGAGCSKQNEKVLLLDDTVNGTAFYCDYETVKCRLYKYMDAKGNIAGSMKWQLKNLQGEGIDELEQFKIGYLELDKNQ